MATKIFEVEVRNISTGIMQIAAEDEQNAKQIAGELMDAGQGEFIMDFGGGSGEATDAQAIMSPTETDTDNAEKNRLAYLELTNPQ